MSNSLLSWSQTTTSYFLDAQTTKYRMFGFHSSQGIEQWGIKANLAEGEKVEVILHSAELFNGDQNVSMLYGMMHSNHNDASSIVNNPIEHEELALNEAGDPPPASRIETLVSGFDFVDGLMSELHGNEVTWNPSTGTLASSEVSNSPSQTEFEKKVQVSEEVKEFYRASNSNSLQGLKNRFNLASLYRSVLMNGDALTGQIHVLVELRLTGVTDLEKVTYMKLPGLPELDGARFVSQKSEQLKILVSKPDQDDEEYIINPNEEFTALVDAQMGDKVTFRWESSNFIMPDIQGLPKIWVSGLASSRSFICSPNYSPGDFNPFIPFEDQVHMYVVNTYPEDFEVRAAGWEFVRMEENEEFRVPIREWSWTAERRTDPDKEKYAPHVKFPKTKTFNNGKVQREDQSVGYMAQMLHYWKNGTNGGATNAYQPGDEAPKYLLDVDDDEVLYVGSKKLDTKNNWDGDGLAGPRRLQGTMGPFNNWQYMWPGEASEVQFNEKGFFEEDKGYVLNDYISTYRQYKERESGNTEYDEYYQGYMIEDYGLWREGNLMGDMIAAEGSESAVCAVGCKYNPEAIWTQLDGANGNNKHPGRIKVSASDPDASTYKFKLRVSAPVSEDKGFYGQIQGTNTPMGWGAPGTASTYTLTGLQGMTAEQLSRYSLALLTYDNGGATYAVPGVQEEGVDKYGGTCKLVAEASLDSLIKNKSRPDFVDDWNFDSEAGTFSVDFRIKDGPTVVAAYYTVDSRKAMIAGRDLWVMDPLQQITAPGSNSYPFADGSQIDANEVDLKEGIGERVYEYTREAREKEDIVRGFADWKLEKYTRDYVIRKGDRITFAATDVGTGKIEIFNKYGPPHLYMWRDLAKYMSPDTVAKYLTYKISRVQSDGFNSGSKVEEVKGRYLTKSWDEVGVFEVAADFMGNPYAQGRIKVTVVDDGEYPVSEDWKKLQEDFKRGSIGIRELLPDERGWLSSQSLPEGTNLDDYVVAEVSDVLSEYTYVAGPRATYYSHRFGSYNDYADAYSWYSKSGDDEQCLFNPLTKGGTETLYEGFEWYASFDEQEFWSDDWNDVWLRHTSSNYFPTETINNNDVLRDPMSPEFTELLENAFSRLGNQKGNGFVRWLPWIAHSPYQGFKIGRPVKPMVDLETMFNGLENSGNSVWSGRSDFQLPFLHMAVEKYTPMTDEQKNQLEFYYDLKYGRKLLIRYQGFDELIVKNVNPLKNFDEQVDAKYSVVIQRHQEMPSEIFISSWKKQDVSSTIDFLAKSAYEVFRQSRDRGRENSGTGLYYDAYKLNGESVTEHDQFSIAATGMGLVALTIADKMDWEKGALELAKETMKSMTNHLDQGSIGFKWKVEPDYGYPAHWDSKEGLESYEYSTVDAAIAASGALFAKKYFTENYPNNDAAQEVANLADQFYKSIDWSAAVVESGNGGELHRVMDFQKDNPTLPFNEYMILANLVQYAGLESNRNSDTWNNWFNPDDLPKKEYLLHSLLTDNEDIFIPSFNSQFAYFLCHDFTESGFGPFYKAAMDGDKAWWNWNMENMPDKAIKSWEWGLGAGSAPIGYSANSINRNDEFVVSPHIMAGFLTLGENENTITDHLNSLYSRNKSDYKVIDDLNNHLPLLWRYSKEKPGWRANQIELIDWSSMLFGLALVAESNKLNGGLGVDFFSHYNDYHFPARPKEASGDALEVSIIYPNTADDNITIEFQTPQESKNETPIWKNSGQLEGQIELRNVQVSLLTMEGKVALKETFTSRNQIDLDVSSLEDGLYLLKITQNGKQDIRKIVIGTK